MNFKKILISIICSFFFVQNAFAAQFTDVVEQSLFYDAVNYFVTEVPILATDREEFNPLDKVTKAEFFKLLIRSGGYDPENKNYDIPYNDVSGDEWFAPYLNKALDLSVLKYNEFNPNFNAGHTVTRAQAFNWIFDFYEINTEAVNQLTIDYTDVNPEDPYANISKIAYEFKLLHDHKTQQFNADKELTRAETIHIFYQIHKNQFSLPNAESSDEEYIDTSDANFALFYEVWSKVTQDYIDKNEIDEDELIYGAISGMVTKLDDPYSVFFEPVEADLFNESLEGEFDGIGIYLTQESNNFVILTPLKGSPAEEAGLKPNDIIIEIDDEPITGLEIENVIELLRGETGTTVKLKIKRNGNHLLKYVERAKIDVPYVESEIINNIGVIHYYQFTTNSHSQFESELENVTSTGVDGIIIDLRNNPGGYLYSAQELVSEFLPSGTPYVNIIFADGTTYTEKSSGPGDLENIPLIVLINDGSASASEIAALAFRDQLNADIVGLNSYGKSKIQEIVGFPDGSTLKLSIARWVSPNGTDVSDTGIEPDYLVRLNETDTQLKKALELIKN